MESEIGQLINDHPYLTGAGIFAGSVALTTAYMGTLILTHKVAERIYTNPRCIRFLHKIGLTNLADEQVEQYEEHCSHDQAPEERERL